MGIMITCPHEESSGTVGILGAICVSSIRNVPTKMLVMDENGNMVPCDYQHYFWRKDDHYADRGNIYVPSGMLPVDPETLSVIETRTFESRSKEGSDFHDFVRTLMENSSVGAQFIMYNGAVEEVLPREHWDFFGFKIPKRRRIHFVHRFSLCGIKTS